MKSIGSISSASFLILIVSFFGLSNQISTISQGATRNITPFSTLTAEVEPNPDQHQYKAGVLIGDYLSVIFLYILVLILQILSKTHKVSGICVHYTTPGKQMNAGKTRAEINHCDCPFHSRDQTTSEKTEAGNQRS